MKQPFSTRLFTMFIVLVVAACGNDNKNSIITRSSDAADQKYTLTKQEAIEDFITVRKALEAIHPSLYKYTPKTEMNAFWDSLQATIKGPVSIIYLYKLVRLAVCRVKCSHSFVEFTDNLPGALTAQYKHSLFDAGVFYHCGKYYLSSTDPTKNLAELISIDKKTSSTLFNELGKYANIDGGNNTIDSFDICDDFYFKYFLNYNLTSPEESEKAEKGFVYTPISYTKNGGLTNDSLGSCGFPFIIDGKMNDPFFAFPLAVGNDLYVSDSGKYAVLTINSFSFSDDKRIAYRNFIKNTFSLLSYKPGIEKLIIDLRDNGGGSFDDMCYLASFTLNDAFKQCISAKTKLANLRKPGFKITGYHGDIDFIDSVLAKDYDSIGANEYALNAAKIKAFKPAKNSFTGKIIILTNNNTGSSSSGFASLHHDRKRAVIIGGETNGNYTGNSSFYQVAATLPNSQLKVIIPVVQVQYEIKNNRYIKNRGVIPDILIHQNLDDVIKGIDTQMQFAKKLQ